MPAPMRAAFDPGDRYDAAEGTARIPAQKSPLGVDVPDHLGRFSLNSIDDSILLSPAAAEFLGLSPTTDRVSMARVFDQFVPADVSGAVKQLAEAAPGARIDYRFSVIIDGSIRALRARGITSDGDRGGLTFTGTIELDTAERETTGSEIALSGALEALDHATVVVSNASDEAELISEVCQQIRLGSRSPLVWYGAALHDVNRTVSPQAWSGEDRFVTSQTFTWGDGVLGDGPVGRAIKTGTTQFTHCIDESPHNEPWAQSARMMGYKSSIALPVEVDGEVGGAIVVYAHSSTAFGYVEVMILENLARQLGYGIARIRDHDRAQMALNGVLGVLEEALAAHEPYTTGHEDRVSELATAIATQLGLATREIEGIRLGAILHDIGKIGIPAALLNSPRRLTSEEFELIKTHPAIGAAIVSRFDFPYPVAEMVRHHHERMDGSGYPDGLAGSDVTMAVRIIAVADVVDSMARARSYRQALGPEAALQEITGHAGILYDADVVDACVELVGLGILDP